MNNTISILDLYNTTKATTANAESADISKLRAYSEAGEEEPDIPTGELGPDGPVEEEGGEEMEVSDDTGFDDTGFDDTEDEEGAEGEEVIKDPMDNVEDSEKYLAKDLRAQITVFYDERQQELERISSSNIESSEEGEALKKLVDRYKISFDTLKSYIKDEFDSEPLSTRIESFIQFKALFNTLNKGINALTRKIGSNGEESNQ